MPHQTFLNQNAGSSERERQLQGRIEVRFERAGIEVLPVVFGG
jgi:hypothetical protein